MCNSESFVRKTQRKREHNYRLLVSLYQLNVELCVTVNLLLGRDCLVNSYRFDAEFMHKCW